MSAAQAGFAVFFWDQLPGLQGLFNQSRNVYKTGRRISGPVIVQFAKGDVTVPNPTSSAILRAGDLQDHAYAANPGGIPRNLHTFVTNIAISAAVPSAIAGQSQITAFFASNGALANDPDGPSTFFEVPVMLPPPQVSAFAGMTKFQPFSHRQALLIQ